MITGRVRILVSLGAVSALIIVLINAMLSFQLSSTDFATYMQAALTVRHGGDPFGPVMSWITHYTGGELRADYYVYTPAFAGLLIPFTFLPLRLALTVWGVCNLMFLIGAVWCSVRATGRYPRIWQVLVFAAVCGLLKPVRAELQWGQADILLTFLVSASFLAARSNRPGVGGVLLALAAITKPPILALLLFYCWKRQWRLTIVAVVGFLVLLVTPCILLGAAVWREQLEIWQFWSRSYTPFIDNIAPRGVLMRLLSRTPYGPGIVDSPVLATILWISVLGLVGALAVRFIGRQDLREDQRAPAEFSLAICILCLISPLTEWIYLTLLVIPLVIWTTMFLSVRPQKLWQCGLAASLAIYVVLCLPLARLEGRAWSGMMAGGIQQAFYVFYGAAFLYPLLGAYLLAMFVVAKQSPS